MLLFVHSCSNRLWAEATPVSERSHPPVRRSLPRNSCSAIASNRGKKRTSRCFQSSSFFYLPVQLSDYKEIPQIGALLCMSAVVVSCIRHVKLLHWSFGHSIKNTRKTFSLRDAQIPLLYWSITSSYAVFVFSSWVAFASSPKALTVKYSTRTWHETGRAQHRIESLVRMCAAEREPALGSAVRQLQDGADNALATRQRRRARVQRLRPLRQTARGTPVI